MAATLESAPKDGTVFEGLFEGEWMEVRWAEDAYDGSPYGHEGWAQLDGNYAIFDLEGWRPLRSTPDEPSGLLGHHLRQPIVVVGLGFGDEAKGSTVDYLSSTIPDAAGVVRWSGGANASHNVRHGHRHHSFRQYGSGSLLGLPTFLNDRVVVNLQMLMAEAVDLEAIGVHNPLSLMVLHGDSSVTTPIHMALNRAREILRGSARHGSCGLGIGETIVHSYAERGSLHAGDKVGNFEVPGETAEGQGVLTVGMLRGEDEETLDRVVSVLKKQAIYADGLIEAAKQAIPELADELFYGSISSMAQELVFAANSVDVLDAASFEHRLVELMDKGTVIFEGSQGLLLDERWGFHPHTTWAQTEPSALIEWLQHMEFQPYILGLTRSFMTRHGAGPLPSESADVLDENSIPEDDNGWGRWQGDFRNAPLDLPLLRYSKKILAEGNLKLDGISISHLDAFGDGALAPVIVSYGGIKEPSKYWSFESDGAADFPRSNSDEFLREMVEPYDPELRHYPIDALPLLISRALGAPAVLTATGPKRTDRELQSDLPEEA